MLHEGTLIIIPRSTVSLPRWGPRGFGGALSLASRLVLWCMRARSDPAYDETQSADAACLAAKYGSVWLRAALPHRADTPGAAHGNPLQLATVRGVRRLARGCGSWAARWRPG